MWDFRPVSTPTRWPLPRSIPAWNDVTATFAGDLPLDANTVWKVLAWALVALPGDETLTADLVSAHVAGGDCTTAERVVDAYARAMEDLGYDEPSTALYGLLEKQRAS